MAQSLTIGQVARATGVPARTIRYYEQVGVLPPPDRTAAGYRQYTEHGVHRLRFVRRGRALGLQLDHLRSLVVALDGSSRGTVRRRLRELVGAQRAVVQQQISELQRLDAELEQIERRLRGPSPADRRAGCRCLDTD